MNIIETSNAAEIDFGGSQIWHPDFRTIPLDNVLERIEANTQWKPFGYVRAILWREAGTVFLYRFPAE